MVDVPLTRVHNMKNSRNKLRNPTNKLQCLVLQEIFVRHLKASVMKHNVVKMRIYTISVESNESRSLVGFTSAFCLLLTTMHRYRPMTVSQTEVLEMLPQHSFHPAEYFWKCCSDGGHHVPGRPCIVHQVNVTSSHCQERCVVTRTISCRVPVVAWCFSLEWC